VPEEINVTVAYVLSGGASLGSIQVGMLQALEAADMAPDMIFGTSVGAVNGAWLANQGSIDDLAGLWRGLSAGRLFPIRPFDVLKGIIGQSTHLVPSDGLRAILEEHLTFDRLEDAALPLTVITANARTGAEVQLSSGPALDAVLASAAIPGIYPPVEWEGEFLIDGGIVNNTPITTAIDAGASEVWVLSTGWSCDLPEAPTSALGLAMVSISQLIQLRLELEIAAQNFDVPVRLIPPPCPIEVTPIDFSQTEELIERARGAATTWLDGGMPDASALFAPHTHDELGRVVPTNL